MVEHEAAFIRSFVIRDRRKRYLSKLSSDEERRTFLDRLNHRFLSDLDARFIMRGARPWPTDVDQCYIFADEGQYDQRFVTPAEAADALSSAFFGIVVSFVPGKLACYQNEAPSDVVWLQRE